MKAYADVQATAVSQPFKPQTRPCFADASSAQAPGEFALGIAFAVLLLQYLLGSLPLPAWRRLFSPPTSTTTDATVSDHHARNESKGRVCGNQSSRRIMATCSGRWVLAVVWACSDGGEFLVTRRANRTVACLRLFAGNCRPTSRLTKKGAWRKPGRPPESTTTFGHFQGGGCHGGEVPAGEPARPFCAEPATVR